MDPISASNFNLSAHQDRDVLDAATASTKSLSRYETRNFKNLLPQVLAAAVSTASHIAVGIALAYSAILIPQLEREDSDLVATKGQLAWVASVVPLLAPVGSMVSGYLMDKVGRINTLKLSMGPAVAGWIMIAMSSNISMLLAGRVLAGFSSTMATNPAAVYITEIARKDMRGSLIILGPTYVSFGMVIGYLKGWLMDWRLLAWLCNIYIIIPFLLLFCIPESPVWLVSKNRIEEARQALSWLHKHQPPIDDSSFAELTLNLIIMEDKQKKLEAKKSGSNVLKEFLKPTGYKPLLILSGIFFFQQFSGIYIFLFYSVTFFASVGSSFNPYVASIWIGVIRLIMSFLNTWLLKYFNRRILIMISALGMGISTLISGFFTQWIKDGTTTLSWVPVVFLLFYVVASMVGLLTIPWTMTAELFPLKIRGLAHSITTSIVNLMMFFAVQNYLSMEEALGGSAGIQWFFSGVSFAAVIYTFVFLPETHRKKLSEIEDYFKSNTLYIGKKKKTVTLPRSENGHDKSINQV